MRRRILRAFVLFGATLVVAYAALVFAAMQRLEDNIFIQRLDVRADRLAAALEGGGAAAGGRLPIDDYQTFVGAGDLPPELRRRIADWPAGDYEIHDAFPGTDLDEHFIAIRDLEAGGERLYVVFDTRAIGSVETWWTPLLWVLAGGAVLVLALGLPFGRRLAHQLASPLVELAEIVETSTPEEMSRRLARDPSPAPDAGEVEVLRGALRRSMERTAAFVERERRFTRNASHELRTPVTVIRGATDLLARQLDGDDRAGRRLARIERSLDHMEELIEAFLALAREDEGAAGDGCEVGAVLRDVVERLAAEPEAGGVALEVRAPQRLAASPAIVASTLHNLLANALQHTPEGEVRVVLDGPRLEIVDRGPGIAAGRERELSAPFVTYRRGGTGVGLSIVEEVCRRHGWRLRFAAADGGGTRTLLDFVPDGGTGVATPAAAGAAV